MQTCCNEACVVWSWAWSTHKWKTALRVVFEVLVNPLVYIEQCVYSMTHSKMILGHNLFEKLLGMLGLARAPVGILLHRRSNLMRLKTSDNSFTCELAMAMMISLVNSLILRTWRYVRSSSYRDPLLLLLVEAQEVAPLLEVDRAVLLLTG